VTVNLRNVDVRTGQVVNSVSVTKTIFSHEVSSSIYKFVSYKTLLQAEGGYSTNEPSQLAVKEAIESAVIHLTVQGVRDQVWALNNPQDWFQPIVQNYLREAEALWLAPEETGTAGPLPMRTPSLVKAPQPPVQLAQQPSAPTSPPVAPPPQVAVQAPAAVPTPVSKGWGQPAPLPDVPAQSVSEPPVTTVPSSASKSVPGGVSQTRSDSVQGAMLSSPPLSGS
jgi:curli production assembly/transport component CsgG